MTSGQDFKDPVNHASSLLDADTEASREELTFSGCTLDRARAVWWETRTCRFGLCPVEKRPVWGTG